MEIGIYTSLKILKHKIRLSVKKHVEPRWALHNMPAKSNELDKIWFAVDYRWMGYFQVKYIKDLPRKSIVEIILGKWHLSKDLITERKPFQGFTYKTPN